MGLKVFEINFIKAEHGDCIHISFTDDNAIIRYILIDGGPASTYIKRNGKKKLENGPLKLLVDELKQIDLLVITHIDDDHIGGILKWFSSDQQFAEKVKSVWFNSPKKIQESLSTNIDVSDDTCTERYDSLETSTKQGSSLEAILEKNNMNHLGYITAGFSHSVYGSELLVLSPQVETLHSLLSFWVTEQPQLYTVKSNDYSSSLSDLLINDIFKEDKKIQNKSSISFIFKHKGDSYLFLGDTTPSEIIPSLKKLGYDKDNKLDAKFIKLSHHGSKKNTSNELLEIVNTSKYIVSTNGKYHEHPDKLCLARIISHNCNSKFYFNYPERYKKIFTPEDFESYPNFSLHSTQELNNE